jgi:hypothetical protein
VEEVDAAAVVAADDPDVAVANPMEEEIITLAPVARRRKDYALHLPATYLTMDRRVRQTK